MTGCNHFVNSERSPAQRRVRYCYLRQLGLPRALARALYGRSDSNIAKSLEYIARQEVEVC